MAVYTITLSDIEGGIGFSMQGPPLHDSEASKLAYALMQSTMSLGQELAKQSGVGRGVSCACAECLARRARGEEPQQGIHPAKAKNHTVH
ncbi:hypothetical protein IPC264_26215 [Pseudomonas aeruginosa]|uniref:hypothetical protein n=1 Tax=Pseudomonas aeruginosa TaxID=287 RepID=UPI000F51BEDE|nr:hypothetical protein [Pseudomonas aeruginosa]RQF48536.1 hypothetical protein IPC264_26215 [Pseudomonas aeruginosa]